MNELFAQTATAAASQSTYDWSKGIMIGIAFGMASLSLGLIGMSYMNAVGRNPEASKHAGQVMVLVAMIDLTILLAFLLGAFILK
jgi:F0F1-type ATP synthase membrane subunit c/vacuolar-type H+-ATPase subunit K